MDSKISKPNSNDPKGIRNFRNRIRTIRKGFESFETNLEPFERDSKLSNANSNHLKGIRTFLNQRIQSIQM